MAICCTEEFYFDSYQSLPFDEVKVMRYMQISRHTEKVFLYQRQKNNRRAKKFKCKES